MLVAGLLGVELEEAFVEDVQGQGQILIVAALLLAGGESTVDAHFY